MSRNAKIDASEPGATRRQDLWSYEKLLDKRPGYFVNDNAPYEIIDDAAVIEEWQAQRRTELAEKGAPQAWAEIGLVLDDPYVLVLRDLVKMPSGRLGGYVRVINRADLSGGQGVVVLPVIEKRIAFLRIFRHATRSWHLEIPRGFGEPGILPEEQAKREISEEVGGVVSELFPLGIIHANTGIEGSSVAVFMAQMASIGRHEKEEGISGIVTYSIQETEHMIAASEITDAFSVGAIYRAKLHGML